MVSRKSILIMNCIGVAFLISMCMPLDNIDVFLMAVRMNSKLDVHYFWMNSIIYGGIYGYYFIYILAGLSYADCFCKEYSGGIWRYLIIRKGLKRYAVGNCLKAFFVGGLTAAGGGMIFLGAMSRLLPLFMTERSVEVEFLPFSEILIRHPEIYFLIMLYLMLLSGGLWTCVSYCVSAFLPVKYFVHIVPFAGLFLLTRINSMLHIPEMWRLDFLLCGRAGPKRPVIYILLVTLIVIAIIGGCCGLFYKKIAWRISNE